MELLNSDQAKVRHSTVKELATADRNLKLPSQWPSVVSENCLYSQQRDARARAFYIVDPQGVVDMLLVFLERRDDGLLFPSLLDDRQDSLDRISPFLGSWKGPSVTKRSGVYGETIAVADSVASLEMDDNGQLTQVVSTTTKSGEVTTNIHWTGSLSGNLATFDEGYQLTLLPSGMFMGYPSVIAKSVAESKSFHLEFCWLKAPERRQRLIRAYHVQGLAVLSTYFLETKS